MKLLIAILALAASVCSAQIKLGEATTNTTIITNDTWQLVAATVTSNAEIGAAWGGVSNAVISQSSSGYVHSATEHGVPVIGGGFRGGVGSALTIGSGGAIGYNATVSDSGGAVGEGASADIGGAVGYGATEAGAINAGGGAVGHNAHSSGDGGAVGDNAHETGGGGAVGFNSSAGTGGAIGIEAKTSKGFAGGESAFATTDGAMTGTGIDAIQLGTGGNTNPLSLQIYSYPLMNPDGTIPSARIPYAASTNAPAWIAATNTEVTITLTNDMERPQYLYATGAVSVAFEGLRPPQPFYLVVKGPDSLTFPTNTHFVGGASWQTNQANHFIVWQYSTNLFVNPVTTSTED